MLTEEQLNAKVNPDYMEGYILTHILANRELEDNDNSYKIVSGYSVREALDYYLTWNGIIGYTENILNVIKSLLDSSTELQEPIPEPTTKVLRICPRRDAICPFQSIEECDPRCATERA